MATLRICMSASSFNNEAALKHLDNQHIIVTSNSKALDFLGEHYSDRYGRSMPIVIAGTGINAMDRDDAARLATFLAPQILGNETLTKVEITWAYHLTRLANGGDVPEPVFKHPKVLEAPDGAYNILVAMSGAASSQIGDPRNNDEYNKALKDVRTSLEALRRFW